MSYQSPGDFLLGNDLRTMDSVALLYLCAADTSQSPAWAEFLRRFTPKIKAFIRGTLRQSAGESLSGENQQGDLFQSTIVRLVQDDCAVMKRFTGATEEELLAYLAVITRSVVRDFLRQRNALKRPDSRAEYIRVHSISPRYPDEIGTDSATEKEILTQEVIDLTLRLIKTRSGEYCGRDELIFKLYYFQGLSTAQIARCGGVNLSKRGVIKVLSRLMDRVRTAAAGSSEATTQ